MESFLLLGLAIVGGWVLGIAGFFQARRARRDLAELRRTLAAGEKVLAEPDPMAAHLAELRAGEAAAAPAYAAPPQPAPAPADPFVRPSPFGPPPGARGSVPAAGPPTVSASAPEPEAYGPPPPPAPPKPRLDIEALLTMRWGVWLGAAALLLSGVFLVRYAAEQGWLGPEVRSVLALLLGGALLGGAEWLRRRPAPALQGTLAADHAPAALAAGGAAVLFGAAYATGVLYELVPALAAFVLMALAALVGIVASLRFGPLVGVIGLAAAFATPALVDSQAPYAPGLFGYLLFVTAAASVVVRFSAWAWLGWAATLGGAFWVALATTGELGPEYWAPGLFVPAAAALHLLLLPGAALDHPVGRRLSWVPMLLLGLAGVWLSGEVSDFSVRLGVLLLAPLAVAKGAIEPRLDRLPWLTAGLFLLVMLVWAMPAWEPTGEFITIEGVVQAFLPGAWAPEVIHPLLFTALAMAAFFAAAGLAMERRATNPVRWAGLAAAVPVLALGLAYLQVARFQADILWALAGAALAAGLLGAATLAMREDARQRAGAHAAGAMAAMCFGAGVLLHDQWVTLAIALFLPPLAWIEARADLPALRRVALAVAGLVLGRLLLNWYVLDYRFGTTPLLNGLWLAYFVPAACFFLAARIFRRRADDIVVAVLEAGAVAFTTVFVALQIRHWAQDGAITGDGDALEAGLHVTALAVQALAGLFIARRTGRAVARWAWRIQGALALAGGALLLFANPIWTGATASQASLLFGYLFPAMLAAAAAAQPEARQVRQVLGGYALLAGFAWLSLVVRLLYHPGQNLDIAEVLDAEMWSWSGVWLAYGGSLMAAGIRFKARAIRLAALGVIAVVVAKVFLLDMAELDGLWRVLSFLGLGLGLIALGAVFRRFVAAAPATLLEVPGAAAPGTPAAPP